MEHGESGHERVCYPRYDEHRYCTALRSIDTVRALHQTVVSLRSALDESRQEIEKLKKQIIINNEIQDARPCHHPEISQSIDYKTLGDKVSELEKIYYKTHPKDEGKEATITDDDEQDEPVKRSESRSKGDAKKASTSFSLVPTISISTQNLNDTSTHSTGGGGVSNQMASRIDVKIKVSSNINVDNNDTSTETSERSDSPAQQSETDTKDEGEKSTAKARDPSKRENPIVEVEMYEDSNSNTFNVDAKNLKIRVTSEDNINITKSTDRISMQQSSSEYLNLDIDEMSEGDNSVFTEGATTPIEQRLQQVEDIGSGDEASPGDDGELPREERDENEEIPEEVDDIELIFSSEDNKDAIQEDLVSLSEYEPWQEGSGETGAPILTKFSTLTSEDRDREAYYEKKKALKAARVAKANQKSVSVDSHYGGRDKSLESTDSLSYDINSGQIDYKSSSLEKDSSIDNTISRDASFDTFKQTTAGMGKKWTNVNVLIETDISKVGIGDENILDMGRRNTCPNPPLYR